jgi:hypothetical protein
MVSRSPRVREGGITYSESGEQLHNIESHFPYGSAKNKGAVEHASNNDLYRRD